LATYDEDGDGFLSFDEYEHLYETLFGASEDEDHGHNHKREIIPDIPVKAINKRQVVDHDEEECFTASELFHHYDANDDDIWDVVRIDIIITKSLIRLLE
jgi:hypothetical protein